MKLLYHQVDEQHGEAFAFLELEGANLELLQHLESNTSAYTPPAIKKPYCPHFALATDDLDATVEKLNQSGIPIVDGPLEIANTVRWLYFSDPDNNIGEYIQYLRDFLHE